MLSALEEGGSVACLQKESTPIAQGNNASGFILELSTANAIEKWMQAYRKTVQYRTNLSQLEFFARHSGETLCWLDKVAGGAGYPASTYNDTTRTYGDETAAFRRHTFGIKPENNGHLIRALALMAEERGVSATRTASPQPRARAATRSGSPTGRTGWAHRRQIGRASCRERV